jgi:polyhydroxyalkanoate synthesis regulator phasin
VTENTRQVLEMLAEGKITTEEADRLISALREQPSASGAPPAKKPRYLRVIVDSNDASEGPVKINIKVFVE